VTLILETNRLRHGRVLATLFVVYGGAHLLAAGFVWLIVFALARAGYPGTLPEGERLALLFAPVLAVLPPLVAGYALLRGKPSAERMVVPASAAVLMFSATVAVVLTRPALSANRAAFAVIYCAASAALSFYGFWFTRKSPAVRTRRGAEFR
jgi:hypothetical protein